MCEITVSVVRLSKIGRSDLRIATYSNMLTSITGLEALLRVCQKSVAMVIYLVHNVFIFM